MTCMSCTLTVFNSMKNLWNEGRNFPYLPESKRMVASTKAPAAISTYHIMLLEIYWCFHRTQKRKHVQPERSRKQQHPNDCRIESHWHFWASNLYSSQWFLLAFVLLLLEIYFFPSLRYLYQVERKSIRFTTKLKFNLPFTFLWTKTL